VADTISAPPPVPAGGLSPRELDTRYYAGLLWRSRLLLVAAALGGLALGLLAAEAQTPVYRARTLLQVAPPVPTSMNVADALMMTGNPIRDRQFFNTQLNVLYSRALSQRVVERLKLADQPPFKDSADPAGLLTRHLQVEPVPETFVIEVRISHTDPQEAALWANTLADVYIDYSIEGQVESAKRAYDWVSARLQDTQRTMQDAQDKLLKSYQAQEMFVPDGSVSAVASSIGKLNEDHVQAQARRIALEAEIQEFSDARRRGSSLENLPRVAADAMVLDLAGKLQALTIDLSRLKEKYKQAHPEVQKVQLQIDQIRKARQARGAQIEEALRAEYRQLQRSEADLRGAIDAQKSQAVAQSRKLTELESLKKQADSANNLYSVLLQKLNETNIASSIQNSNVRLLDRAVPPLRPVTPQKRRLALYGLLAGLVLGAAHVLLRDYVADTIKDAEDVERYLHLDVLAAIPRYDRESVHMAVEAYQALRTALLFSRKHDRGHVVLVTGTAPGEGKTHTVLNLAKVLASSGESVVVVDGDLRRATVHQRLGLPRDPGFTDLFTRSAELSSLLRPAKAKNVVALTAGPLPPNPPALLARADVAVVLDQLRAQFRWVMLDSPPLASVTDALLLAPHADVALVVVHHDKVDKKVIKRSVGALRKVTPHVLGAVLNAVNPKGREHYYYYYHYPTMAADKGRARAAARGAVVRPEVSDAPLV
jgi:capsular exopolysaccharide synthesis family protein